MYLAFFIKLYFNTFQIKLKLLRTNKLNQYRRLCLHVIDFLILHFSAKLDISLSISPSVATVYNCNRPPYECVNVSTFWSAAKHKMSQWLLRFWHWSKILRQISPKATPTAGFWVLPLRPSCLTKVQLPCWTYYKVHEVTGDEPAVVTTRHQQPWLRHCCCTHASIDAAIRWVG